MTRTLLGQTILTLALIITGSGALAAPTLAPATLAPAGGQVALRGDVKAEKSVVVNGVIKLQLVAPKAVLPGDRLLFSTAFTNTGAKPVQNFVVTNPVPAAVSVAPDSAAALQVSVDGGKSWGRLASLTLANGKGGRRGALATDITHIRWTIPVIAPGASGKVEYHAIVR